MADEIPDLIAEVRTGSGKGAARQSRREGKVPGVVYGGGADPLSVNLEYNYLLKRLREGRFLSKLWNLKVEGQEDVRVICRSVQRDVIKDLPTHVDLMRLRRTSRINLFINVDFINHGQAPGLKKGGTLTAVRSEIELNVVAGDIPEKIVVDLTDKQIGDVIHINDITLPEGAKPTVARNFVIANIAAPKGLKAEEEEETEEEEI